MKELKKFLKNNKKILTIIGIIIVTIIIFLLVYKIFFASSSSNRYEGIESHKLTKKEINNVKEVIKELDNVKSSKVYVDSKIIRIFVNLENDVELDAVKEVANKAIAKIDKDNLEYYDLECFVDSNKDSKVYPRIGYKHKSSEKFAW